MVSTDANEQQRDQLQQQFDAATTSLDQVRIAAEMALRIAHFFEALPGAGQ